MSRAGKRLIVAMREALAFVRGMDELVEVPAPANENPRLQRVDFVDKFGRVVATIHRPV